jgi:acetoacetyl-CoA synthetase
VLGVSPIGWSNNLLGFGADSLAVINLLLEIEGYAGHPLPLLAFLAAPSIEGLATTLSVGAEGMTAQQAGRSGPHLRAAGPDDREPICRFLEQTFRESGIKAATWRRLFDHGWSDHGRGFVLLDGNTIVGFLGAIAARRQVNGQAVLVCNISSWSVDAKYRGWGIALLAALLRDENPNQIYAWRKQLLEQAARAFESGSGDAGGGHAREIEKLHVKIGQWIVEHFLAKRSGR